MSNEPPPPTVPSETPSGPSHSIAPPITPYGTSVGGVVVPGIVCIDCGYDLAGLHESGACPECGAEIERSLKGDLMLYAPAEYLATLHRGSFIVLTVILLQVLGAILGIGVVAAMSTAQPQTAIWIELALSSFGLLLSALLVWGWWLLSTPLPSLTEKPWVDKARQWVRYVLIASVAVTLGQLVTTMVVAAGNTSDAVLYTQVGLGLGSTLIWLGTYIVHGTYLAWLAKRIPDAAMQKRAKLVRWLCPVLSTVGILLIGLGPLIALILYWNLIDKFRKAFKRLRSEQEALEHFAAEA